MSVKAVILDVDGTLYRQRPVRLRMIGRLFQSYFPNPPLGLKAVQVLRAYRRAQEVLRREPGNVANLAELQLELACRWSHTPTELARSPVTRWMEEEPLHVLPGFIRQGVEEFLIRARRRGVRL